MNNSIKKGVVVAVILLFVSVSVIPSVPSEQTSTGDIITVDDEGDGDYTNIQDAVDNAKEGDIIKVYSGIYEPTRIEKTIILEGISHELGSGSDTGKPVINGRQGKGRLIYLCAVNDCLIQCFELYNGEYGILLIDSSNNILSENNISKCLYGIHAECILGSSSNNVIEKNYITDNGKGLFLEQADNNTIRNNVITHNAEQGVLIYSAFGNKVYNNHLSHNGQAFLGPIGDAGVTVLGSSDDTVIEKNRFDYNTYGVFLAGATDTSVRCNNFLRNIRKEVYAAFTFTTVWENNYWKRPRLLPKPVLVIKGIVYLPPPFWEIKIHGIQFDWHPSPEPYDIGV